jgi:hypothetical protein
MNTCDLLKEHYYYETYYLNEKNDDHLKYRHVDFDFVERNKRFSEILFACANIDGNLSIEEKNFILGSCLARGCSEQFIETLDPNCVIDLEQAVKSFAKDYHSNMASMVYQILKVCSIDGQFSPDEVKVVDDIAHWVNMPDETLKALKALYQEDVEVSRKLRHLCHYM